MLEKRLYLKDSILDRLSRITPRQNKRYQELREQGMTIKEALNIAAPLKAAPRHEQLMLSTRSEEEDE